MKRPRSSSTAFTRISHTPCSSLDSNTSANVAPPPCGTSGWEATQEILDSPRTDVNLAPLGGTGACRSSTTDGCRSTRAHADVLRPSPVSLCVRHPPRRYGRQGHSSPGWTTMPKPAAALVLFRLGDRGYATPRDQVLEVVDVGAGQPTVPGLEPSTLAALKAAERLPPLVSLRVGGAHPGRDHQAGPGRLPGRRGRAGAGDRPDRHSRSREPPGQRLCGRDRGGARRDLAAGRLGRDQASRSAALDSLRGA